MDIPITTSELFQLNSVSGGINKNSITFKNITLESDKYVCLRDIQADGQYSLVAVDLKKRESTRNNVRDAESAIMNPEKKVLALRSGRNLQIFDIDASSRLKAVAFHDDVVFWRWIDSQTVGIVTATSVYHWGLNTAVDAAPERIFDRGADYDSLVQILNYRVDANKKWHILCGVTRKDEGMVGKAFLYSMENRTGRTLDGHCGCFISTPMPLSTVNCNIMCLAWNNPQQGAKVMIMELPVGEKTNISLPRRVFDIAIQPGDFPVAMHVSPLHKLLTIVTSRGSCVLMDIFTGAILLSQPLNLGIIFCGTGYTETGGLVCVSNAGSVFHVSIDNKKIIDHVKNRLQNPELALRIASSANLGGVDDLFKVQLENCLRMGRVDEAVQICLRAPAQSLRTREVLLRFVQLPQTPGSPPPISTYFKLVLAETNLNSIESVELARQLLPRNGAAYIKQQFEANKLTPTEELGDLLQEAEPDVAIKIFHKAEAHAKVVSVLLQRNETQKAVEYCKRASFSPDWRMILNNFIGTNPRDAVNLAIMLHRDLSDKPVLDPSVVVDMFVTGQHIQQATEFLLEVLREHNDESTMELQTKLLEINIKFSHPSVSEKIFASGLCKHYDGMLLAPLCERAGLFQRAIDCYITAQGQDPDLDNLASVRRCLSQAQNFNPEWLVDFFGKLNKDDSLKCLADLLQNHRHHFKVIVQVATKYNDALGVDKLTEMFVERNLFDILYYYLGAIVPYTRDPDVHFHYIEAATEVGQMQELERMTRESPCYDPERTKNYLKNKKLTNLWPLINVCDQHNFIGEMVQYLIDTDNEAMIEQFVQRRSPSKTPQVVGALLDCNRTEESIKSILIAVGAMCPIKELVEVVEEKGRLHILKEFLEARANEKKTDPALYTALAKIYVDIGQNPERFLMDNEYYEAEVVGEYCENRDPNYAFLAYKKGHCSEKLIKLSLRDGMWKQLARYLVKEQNLDLWDSVLKESVPGRNQLVEAVQQVALPETQVSEEVSTTVRAFMNAEMTHELTSLLDQIVVNGRFRKNRFLENLLIMSAIRARKDKVMEYVNNLEDFDAKDIAAIATGADMHDVAFAVYDKRGMKKDAIIVLLRDLKDIPRARSYAQKVDTAEGWTALGEYLLQYDEIHEAIEALIRAKNPDFVDRVTAAAERTNQFGDLIHYLTMARQESRHKDSKIDTSLVLTYAKTGRLGDLEEFLKETHNVPILPIADKCYEEGLYESARILYLCISNYAKLALTLVKLNNLSAAVDAAQKAKSISTWKSLHAACLEANELKLANICAVPVVLKAEEIKIIIERYESRQHWEELFSVFKTAAAHPSAHMGIFTEMGVLLAKYRPEKLIEHITMYSKKINAHRLISVCDGYHHWVALRTLYINNEDWLAASHCMMQHHADAWDAEIFKDVISRLGSSDVLYSAIHFYIKTYPSLLNDFLTHVFKKVDPERVITEVGKSASLYLIKPFLEAAQERNSKRINEALNDLYIEEEDFTALRHSVETFNNFDSADLSAELEKMELFEFRKIALFLHRQNKRFSHAIDLAKKNKLYSEAIETAFESGDSELVEGLLDYFVKDYPECFAACLYMCYELISPHVVMEKAFLNNRMDISMPFLIQCVQEYTQKVNKMERSMSEAQKAAKDAAKRGGPLHQSGVPETLLIQNAPNMNIDRGAFHPNGAFQSGRPF